MSAKNILNLTMVAGLAVGTAFAQAPQVPQAAQSVVPADGITMDMMPITPDQLTGCRQQASGQLSDEQKALHDREHGQDKDKMAQGAITGTTGAVTSAISRGHGWGYWGNHSNNGAQTAAATGATQRTDRNSDNVASTTATSQTVGVDAYQQCVLGIKGSEYVTYRSAHPLNGVPAATPVAEPAIASAAVPPPPNASASPVQDEGDGKHFVLTEPGQTNSVEVTQSATNKNAYVDASTGNRYIVMPDGSVKKIVHHK
ncbi:MULTISPECIES: hypothetical protein [Acidobacteriaceae]|uniref:hypothetical protein n=1 Tax=Acidobacteriaceae TaxID=204434 RepID=UPI00131B7C66|nr:MULTISPECIES: hypothetical protein [Acidobacteriaceae]MDW5264858.1 hypothetical protein [Edaphobacter sp.]